jgi:copper chaperone CopZ
MTSDEKQAKRTARAVFTVRDVDCAACALGIEKQVKKIGGVKDVRTSVMLNQVFIDYDESQASLSEITKAIEKAGYSNHLIRAQSE